ncbi:hypothetical protein T484DRAFT_1920784 [Baffinella frigidus]|nr:hypothetical protein T484DRAFT_1920784 [Cryptophyta sp. CCMP2293]
MLAAARGDGVVSLYGVPELERGAGGGGVVLVRVRAIAELTLREGHATCLQWGGASDALLAAGTSNGDTWVLPWGARAAAVGGGGEEEAGGDDGAVVLAAGDGTAVRCLRWCGGSGAMLATGGVDGKVRVWAVASPSWPIAHMTLTRRAWVTSLCWLPVHDAPSGPAEGHAGSAGDGGGGEGGADRQGAALPRAGVRAAVRDLECRVAPRVQEPRHCHCPGGLDQPGPRRTRHACPLRPPHLPLLPPSSPPPNRERHACRRSCPGGRGRRARPGRSAGGRWWTRRWSRAG